MQPPDANNSAPFCVFAALNITQKCTPQFAQVLQALGLQMPSYSDIYVISEKRDLKTINGFLNEFLPDRDEAADEYEFPQYSDNPGIIFRSDEAALRKCIDDRELDYRIYWRALNGAKPEHAMVFFLSDGYVIYGLSTDDAFPEYAADLLAKMKSLLGSGLGYIGHEASPDAENLEQFKREIDVHQP